MHILMMTPQLPYPPRQGTSIRNYNLVMRLAQRHTIDLLTFLAPGDELLPDSPLHRAFPGISVVPQPAHTISPRLRALFSPPLPDMVLCLESFSMHVLARFWLNENIFVIF